MGWRDGAAKPSPDTRPVHGAQDVNPDISCSIRDMPGMMLRASASGGPGPKTPQEPIRGEMRGFHAFLPEAHPGPACGGPGHPHRGHRGCGVLVVPSPLHQQPGLSRRDVTQWMLSPGAKPSSRPPAPSRSLGTRTH